MRLVETSAANRPHGYPFERRWAELSASWAARPGEHLRVTVAWLPPLRQGRSQSCAAAHWSPHHACGRSSRYAMSRPKSATCSCESAAGRRSPPGARPTRAAPMAWCRPRTPPAGGADPSRVLRGPGGQGSRVVVSLEAVGLVAHTALRTVVAVGAAGCHAGLAWHRRSAYGRLPPAPRARLPGARACWSGRTATADLGSPRSQGAAGLVALGGTGPVQCRLARQQD
jgi:hypothetical protein